MVEMKVSIHVLVKQNLHHRGNYVFYRFLVMWMLWCDYWYQPGSDLQSMQSHKGEF